MEQVTPKRKPNPKRLEKTLFVNHKADQALEKRLESITVSSRLRMMELDRQRINLRNEFRLSRRRSLPNSQRSTSPSPPSTPRISRQSSLDPVNTYLLNEYRRVSTVIPSILTSLSSKEEKQPEFVPNLKSEVDQSRDSNEPDMSKILHLVNNVKKMRHDMSVSRRLDNQRPKISFKDLMKDIEAKERQQSESDTYTDGACVLLRRKMNRMRRDSVVGGDNSTVQRMSQNSNSDAPPPDARVLRKRHSIAPSKLSDSRVRLPSVPMVRSMSTLGRQKTDLSLFGKSELERENELLTRVKVSRELENYDRIRGRIGSFMNRFENKRQDTDISDTEERD